MFPMSQGMEEIRLSSREKVGKFSFANKFNDIILLLSDSWLDDRKRDTNEENF
jgi:hypothetical protein